MMLREPKCFARDCVNFLGVNNEQNETKQLLICKAFLGGIPDVIAYGSDLHLKPFPGDRGLQFEKAK